ncbi:MAG: thiamine pyrophosphate-binding protein [Candidatus Rokuibacteriota bacterium]|nr:MAG: thiamine pyrophosphate-binding protein [Candidatus Rokubacteria bacterium]
MARMTGGEAIVKALAREGVKVAFGLPGVQLYGIVTAFRDEPIRFITVRHEGSSTYMADGYARAGGDIGVAVAVPGPGLLNASAGLNTAYAASSPVLMIAGQIPRHQIGKKIGVLHELDDQLDALAGSTKWRRTIMQVADAPGVVREAFAQLRSGRPRPVAIDMPWDTMEEEVELTMPPVGAHPPRAAAPAADVDRAADALLRAERVAIYAGGGVHLSGANEPLAALAEHLQAGVVETPEGKGAISDASDLALGAGLFPKSPLRGYLDGADVVLAVGTRCAVAMFQPAQQVIQIDADSDEIGRNHQKTSGLVGDAKATLEKLLERLRAGGKPRASRKGEREKLRAEVAAFMTQEPNSSILRSLRQGIPEDAVVIAGMTQIGYFSRPFFPVYRPRTYITSSYAGNLGFEYPTALGAKVACPHKPVVMIAGDGGFMYYAQEMATAVQHGINVVAVVFNDNAYGNVARDLDEHWGGKFAAELHNPDFVRLAEAYGAVGRRAKEPSEVGKLIADAIQMDRPVLIEVPVGRMARPVFFSPLKTLPRYQH